MRENIIDQDMPITDDMRLIKRLWKVDKNDKYPSGLEFAYQLLFFKDDKWKQIARIDNQLHEGKPGVHVHIINREKVKWEDMSFEEAEEKIIQIGKKIIEGGLDEDRNC